MRSPFFISLVATAFTTACVSAKDVTPPEHVVEAAKSIKADDAIAASSVFVTTASGGGFCNGVLLTGDFVATATHCVPDVDGKYLVGTADGRRATVEKVFTGKGSDVAILKVAKGSLPSTLKPATLAAGSTSIYGKIELPMYTEAGAPGHVILTKLSGEQDVQESMPGIIAVRVTQDGTTIRGHSGSGVYVEENGQPVLVGIISRSNWRGLTCYTQDLRGQPLLANLTH